MSCFVFRTVYPIVHTDLFLLNVWVDFFIPLGRPPICHFLVFLCMGQMASLSAMPMFLISFIYGGELLPCFLLLFCKFCIVQFQTVFQIFSDYFLYKQKIPVHHFFDTPGSYTSFMNMMKEIALSSPSSDCRIPGQVFPAQVYIHHP